MRVAIAISVLVAATITAGCQTTRTAMPAAAKPMPPVEARVPAAGETTIWLYKDGKEGTSRVLKVDGNKAYYENSEGCSWTNIIGGFEPTPEWANCGGSTGTQTSRRTTGSILPLQVGNRESWEYSGTNTDGNSWASTRNCEVVGTASVTVPAGTFDTYHVVCEDKWWHREWFINAEGKGVKWSRERKIGSSDRNAGGEMIRFNPAGA